MADLIDGTLVTPAEVKEIFETDLTGDELNPFINSAHALIAELLANSGIGAVLLKQIELNLSAHFAAILDPRVERESVANEWSATYQGKTGLGLDHTSYGQQAKALDYTGALASVGQQGISFHVWSEYDDPDF